MHCTQNNGTPGLHKAFDWTTIPHAVHGLYIAGVETFFGVGAIADWNFQFSVILQKNTFCVIATSAASERVFSIDDHVMNKRIGNLKK